MSEHCDHFDVLFDDAEDYIGFAQAVSTLRILDKYETAAALYAGVPNPRIGDTYAVGSDDNYKIYIHTESGWINLGNIRQGATGPQGPQGESGSGIESIIKTGTEGNIDTYTITMTDGTTSTFTVKNSNIDDTSGVGTMDKTWSADKLSVDFSFKADKRDLALTDKKLKYLAELTRGQAWDIEAGVTPAFQHVVPNGAKAVAINAFGGKNVVENQQLLSAVVQSVVSKSPGNVQLDILNIPAEIKALDGYGWSAGDIYNEVDFARKKFIKRVARVDLGTLNWERSALGTAPYFQTDAPIDGIKLLVSANVVANIITALYEVKSVNYLYNNADDMIIAEHYTTSATKNGRIWVRDNRFTEATDFKTSLSGVMLYYELATPVETDISAYVPDDLILDVEQGGTLTFEQSENTNLPVPNDTEYAINLAEATA